MHDILHELKSLDSVTGCWVYDVGGLVVAQDVPAVFDAQILLDSSHYIQRAAESLEFHYGHWETLVMELTSGVLVVWALQPGALVVLAETDVNLPHLNVAVGVAAKKIRAMINPDVVRMPTVAPAALASGMGGMGGLGSGLATASGAGSLGGSGPAWATQSGGSGGSSEEVSDRFMSELNTTLAEYMGPASAILIKRTLRKLGVNGGRAQQSSVRELLESLEQQIPNSQDRAKFRTAVFKIARLHQYT